ncbi:MAG TPA: hypothetical protein IAB12_04545 [Candidatus Ornithospirochaeta avicola]|uniref:Outer membrane protein beta-barrel domain-containing protein n=1 Tax=Candidatus Ornithospirochaeta avicola TaxID=2840896 RepID=A0A9D1TMY9_9SPIO|nr:hypothetical protein [Candidatus Ornithospirochaeta avicola]
MKKVFVLISAFILAITSAFSSDNTAALTLGYGGFYIYPTEDKNGNENSAIDLKKLSSHGVDIALEGSNYFLFDDSFGLAYTLQLGVPQNLSDADGPVYPHYRFPSISLRAGAGLSYRARINNLFSLDFSLSASYFWNRFNTDILGDLLKLDNGEYLYIFMDISSIALAASISSSIKLDKSWSLRLTFDASLLLKNYVGLDIGTNIIPDDEKNSVEEGLKQMQNIETASLGFALSGRIGIAYSY